MGKGEAGELEGWVGEVLDATPEGAPYRPLLSLRLDNPSYHKQNQHAGRLFPNNQRSCKQYDSSYL